MKHIQDNWACLKAYDMWCNHKGFTCEEVKKEVALPAT